MDHLPILGQAKEHLNGAAACKVEVGNYQKTASDQWVGSVDLASTNADVKDLKWYKQQTNNKLRESTYNAMWWNKGTFELKASTRSKGGYSIQQCEIETVLDKNAVDSGTF